MNNSVSTARQTSIFRTSTSMYSKSGLLLRSLCPNSRGGDNVIGSATPGPIRQLLQSTSWNTLADLGQAVVQLQLSLHAESLDAAEARTSSLQRSLFDQAVGKVVDSLTGSDEDLAAISAIPAPIARKVLSDSEASKSLPYFAYRILARGEGEGKIAQDQVADDPRENIDEWILENERALRDNKHSDWRKGLVDYEAHATIVFDHSESSTSSRVLRRRQLPGYTILDELRTSTLSVQPSFASFQAMFTRITGGLLDGLNWSNVFVAGGIVLSTLLCTSESDIARYVSSDIDVYIHGLDPIAANKKVGHIFDVWKSNLPESSRENTLVVRNSRTITFFSDYPVKRIQIVLKLVRDPKEVLLNFDLDVCAMGYDGVSLMMLPRGARALETGYNVFTMDLVQGHYLGQRRASQESRVFKYADKGFGIRFLPSYIRSLSRTFAFGPGSDHQQSTTAARAPTTYPPDLERIALRASRWTQTAIRKYGERIRSRNAEGLLELTHDVLEERVIGTSEPGVRSCLTSFELLMRHVELRKEHLNGNIAMSQEVWASNDYDVGPAGYDDSPPYPWSPSFRLADFKIVLQGHNDRVAETFSNTYREVSVDLEKKGRVSSPNGVAPSRNPPESLGKSSRLYFAPDLSSVLKPEGDIVLLFFGSSGFAAYANKAIEEAFKKRSLPLPENERIIETFGSWNTPWWDQEVEVLKWKVDSILGWQQIDRKIDEVFEILWTFYRCFGEARMMSSADLTRKFLTEVGRRTIRPAPSDEHEAFGRWVLRGAPISYCSYGAVYPGVGIFGWTEEGLDEDDAENNGNGWFE
ncbi:hypothetical protein DL93DRAFT_1837519 [Clavulina sp. PMI_390]|nr:hypothetical protein DL93DRAFT_1837519 [Clavulina sp. PMI_390]